MLAVGPSVDLVICQDELGAPISSVIDVVQVSASEAAHAAGETQKHPPGACIHGHCHHAMTFGVATAQNLSTEPLFARLEALPADQRHPSQGLPRLERPPRA
jgi:hypothetical protein